VHESVQKMVQLTFAVPENSALVGLTVELRKRLAHHAEFRLAVELEDLRIAQPQHLRHHVIGDAARAEPGSERVPKLVDFGIVKWPSSAF
jgi:hypothetical protein